jgi:UrcA family protein
MKSAIASILLTFVFAAPATAEPTAPVTTVRHADLDLDDPADAQTMLRRIHKAAAAVCRASPLAGGNDIGDIERFDACYRQSVERAVVQLDSPRVTAAFQARSLRSELARLP